MHHNLVRHNLVHLHSVHPHQFLAMESGCKVDYPNALDEEHLPMHPVGDLHFCVVLADHQN